MCGIAGFYGITSDNQKQIIQMCNQMIHRGPDASGYWIDPDTNITLGHRRLSILDLSQNGSQPMHSASGRFVIAYNGEIYNFEYIRKKLISQNYICNFRSASDTEVLLEAFEAYGLKAIHELKGMFAIALYDRKEKTLHLIRDRVGEKPLYYGMIGNKFSFSSDLNALKVLEGFDNKINPIALNAFLRYKSIPQPLSIYEHIYKLLPGQILSLKLDTFSFSFQTYWSIREAALNGLKNPFTGSEQEAREALEGLLKSAVREQLISDVPIGAFLSGGIDSPLIVSIMQSICNSPVNTFTIGFEDSKYNEATFAKEIAVHLGTKHTELYISEQELKDVIPILPQMFSEPFADPAALPGYLISKLAKQSVSVTLSGDGGDELFCGYDLYNHTASLWRKFNLCPSGVKTLGASLLQSTPLKYCSKLYNLGEYLNASDIHAFFELFRNEHNYAAHHMMANEAFHSDYLQGIELLKDQYMLPDIDVTKQDLYLDLPDIRASMLYRDQNGFMNDTVLTKVDRTGMFASLENRVPLLDKDIIEFSWSIPIQYKTANGINKKILKDLLYQYVPFDLLNRPKHGFEVPLTPWLSSGELNIWASELLNDCQLAKDGFLDAKTIHQLWSSFNKNHTHVLQIWYILQAESWYRSQK